MVEINHEIYNNLLSIFSEMGKVVSAVANFATKVVCTVANALGPVGTVIVGTLFFGPVGLIVGVTATSIATGDKIIKIKQQIANMINQNQPYVDKAEELTQILERSFFDDQAFQYILKLGEQFRTGLEVVFEDQKEKVEKMKKISFMNGLKADEFNTSGQRVSNMMSAFLTVANLAMAGAAFVSGNPLGIAMAAIDIGLMTFSNITKLFKNIEELEKLEKTKADLELYLKPGGEFDRQMQEIVGYAVSMVKNLCTICYFWNSLVNELTAWIQIFQAINPCSQTLKFQSLTKNLLSSPISIQFMTRASVLEQKIDKVSKSKMRDVQKLEEVFKLVKDFQNENPIEQTFAKISLILKDFTEDSPTFKLLRQYIKEFNDINFFIDASKHLFIRNSVFDSEVPLQKRDQQILTLLRERVVVSEDIEVNMKTELLKDKLTLVVAACTEKFYAHDPNGQIFYGLKISEVRSKANYIRFLGTNTGPLSNSIIEQPEPLPGRTSQINRHKQVKREMIKRWGRKVIESELPTYKLYLKMESPVFKVGSMHSNRLQLIRVIQDKNLSKFEAPNQIVMLSIYKGIDNHDIWPPPAFIWSPVPMYNVMKEIGMTNYYAQNYSIEEQETDDEPEIGTILTTNIKSYASSTDIIKHTSLSVLLDKGEEFLRAYTNPNTLKEVKINYHSSKQLYTFSVTNGANRKGMRYIYRSTLQPLDSKLKMNPNSYIISNVYNNGVVQKIVWCLTE